MYRQLLKNYDLLSIVSQNNSLSTNRRLIMFDKIASSLNRKDEEPNINLAIQLCETEDREGIEEIVNRLKEKKKQIVNDCIKVLYEIGERKPLLIADYVEDFLNLLHSKNNRLVWGAMTTLSEITFLKSDEILQNIDKVIYAYENGSVITIDNSISVFAELVKSKGYDAKEIYQLILKHLSKCRPKEVGQHSERAFICVNQHNASEFRQVIEKRMDSLTKAQQKRAAKIIKKVEVGQFYTGN